MLVLHFYSAIHKAAVLPAAVQNNLQRPILPPVPIHSLWDIFQWNSTRQSQEEVRPVALWIMLLVTDHSQNATSRNTPQRLFLLAASIHSQWTLFCTTGIVPVKVMERAGTVRPVALWIALLSGARRSFVHDVIESWIFQVISGKTKRYKKYFIFYFFLFTSQGK